MSTPNDPHDKHTTKIPVDDVQQTLYAERQKIYPRRVRGIFARLKLSSGLLLLAIFYFSPWLQWNGHQAVLFDLPARKFYLFGLTFWPQDFIYLAFLLMLAALSLFFFTTLAGRLWCGFACPQTIWTDAFLWMERFVEGDRPQQMKLDKEPLSARKLRIKVTKHTLWISFALFTGFTFVGFFTPIRELWEGLTTFSLGGWETFWMLFYGFATYGNAGWMREQICIYMCPYARFQSAMFDKDTLIVAYDEARGEPRGARKKSADYKAQGLGDCVNCTMCVQVCPTGIDIRDGLQYQCISCSACIDICDEVMEKVGYPKGLVRYTTEHRLEGKETHILRPRIVVYGAFLLVLSGILAWGILTLSAVSLDVLRDRNMLYRETDDGMIENIYILKVINKNEQAHEYKVTVEGIEGLSVHADSELISAGAGQVMDVPVRLRADPEQIKKRSTEITFEIQAVDDPSLKADAESRFLGPLL